jgi:hypothetical protein
MFGQILDLDALPNLPATHRLLLQQALAYPK